MTIESHPFNAEGDLHALKSSVFKANQMREMLGLPQGENFAGWRKDTRLARSEFLAKPEETVNFVYRARDLMKFTEKEGIDWPSHNGYTSYILGLPELNLEYCDMRDDYCGQMLMITAKEENQEIFLTISDDDEFSFEIDFHSDKEKNVARYYTPDLPIASMTDQEARIMDTYLARAEVSVSERKQELGIK